MHRQIASIHRWRYKSGENGAGREAERSGYREYPRATLAIAPRSGGTGSSVNGGEMLCLAIATCYCNDLYREAAKRSIAIVRVVVAAQAEFGGPGEPARTLRYRADVTAHADEAAIFALMLATDRAAEIQNTLRRGMPVAFEPGRAERAP